MKYAIKRTGARPLYVAKPGRKHSYTNKVEHAQIFDTYEAANGSRCVENERVVELNLTINWR